MVTPTTHPARPFHVMAKPSGPACSLDCHHGLYLEKERLYPGAHEWAMPEAVLEAFVRQHIEAPPGRVVSFAWQGGEPTLLGVAFFERVVELQKRYAGGRRVENAIQTNGLLLDDRWGEFLARHACLVGPSIDGPASLCDLYRRDRSDRPTFDAVMRGLEILEGHGAEHNGDVHSCDHGVCPRRRIGNVLTGSLQAACGSGKEFKR